MAISPKITCQVTRHYPEYWQRACDELAACDPVMGRIIRRYAGETLHSVDDGFVTLCKAIVGQQISVKAASAIWQRLQGLEQALTPATLLTAEEEALRALGLSRQKVAYLKNIAAFYRDRPTPRSSWDAHDDAAVREALIGIKGVGQWTVDMFLIFHLMRPDVLPLGDIGLQKAISLHYHGEEKLAKQALAATAEAWRPWGTVATWYLWRSLDPEPVQY